jgi:hypothetical protein
LNPEHWQVNKGENMEIKNAIGVSGRQSIRLDSSKKRIGLPAKVEIKPVNRRRKPNIKTDDSGKWFTDSTNVW